MSLNKMEEKYQDVKYEGEVLTDITSFSMVQNIFDGQREVNKTQIETFESIIQLLCFFDSIWIVEPFIYGGDIKIESQELLNELIKSKFVKQFPQTDSDSQTSFVSQFNEIQDIIAPLKIKDYLNLHKDIEFDLRIYEENFGLANNENAKKLADLVNIDYNLIPLTANLLRTNFYFKLVKEIKKNENRLISYSPNVMRSALVNDIIHHQKERVSNEINRILQDKLNEIKNSEFKDINALNKHLYQEYEMELPLLTALILDQCSNKGDVLDQIMILRNDSDVVRMRKWLKNVQIDLYNGNRKLLKERCAELEDISRGLEISKSNKAKIISFLSKPSFIEATATSAVTVNPLPLIIQGFKELGDSSLKYLLKRDYYLLFKLRSKAEEISFSKNKLEEIFGCRYLS